LASRRTEALSQTNHRRRRAIVLIAAILFGGAPAFAATPIQIVEPPARPAAGETPNRDANDPVAVWCGKEGEKLYGQHLTAVVVMASARWGTVWRARLPRRGWYVVCRMGDFALLHDAAPGAKPPG
jgi:hypothetical protein